MTIEVSNSRPKGFMTILGDAFVGETLIARPNSISDDDGIDWTTAAYQWLRNGEPITGATGTTYRISETDEDASISVQFTYTDFLGFDESLTSDPEDPVLAAGTARSGNVFPLNPLVVLGDAVVGETLVARPNAVTDDNGIVAETRTFQWLRDGQVIPGATDQTYAATEADLDANISVVFAYEDGLGNLKSLTSNPKPETEPAPQSAQIVLDDTDVSATHLIGTTTADNLTATEGLERISGREGIDTVLFEGDQANFTVMLSSESVSVSNRSTDQGAIILDDVEFIEFETQMSGADGPLDLEVLGGHAHLERDQLEDIVELYIAYFNRAPDALGLGFWGSFFDDGATLSELAQQFSNQSETRDMYPSDMSNQGFAEQVYSNVLGRTPDQIGLQFWVDALDSNAISRDQYILEILEGAKAPLKPENGYLFIEQQLADRTYLQNKADIGAYFSVHLGMSDTQDASDVMGLFDGSQSSMNAARNAADMHYADALDPNSGDFIVQVVGAYDSFTAF